MARTIYWDNETAEWKCDIDVHSTIVTKTLEEMKRALEQIDVYVQKRQRRVYKRPARYKRRNTED